MKKQLKQLKKTIELAENDPSCRYTTEEIRYMKTRYRQLRNYIRTATKMQQNGFGFDIPAEFVGNESEN
jgi:hypothetical protein